MTKYSFNHLAHAATLVSASKVELQVHEWQSKREILDVQLKDLPHHIQEISKADSAAVPYARDNRITLINTVPRIRLANACEGTANCLYSIAEIAANYANKVSKGALPSSFNAIRKKCATDQTGELSMSLGDLQWYAKVRELRTEWTHYSSIFIAKAESGLPILCVRAYRRRSDQAEFTAPNFTCTIDEFVQWIRLAQKTLDSFAAFLLEKFVIPNLPLDNVIVNAVRDASGFPIFNPDLRLKTESITIREFLRRGGILA